MKTREIYAKTLEVTRDMRDTKRGSKPARGEQDIRVKLDDWLAELDAVVDELYRRVVEEGNE